ncbi:MAG TPA: cation diffusion facilitator family transporter [Gemmatimonadales bacterium]|nr:cation diffusion facilitator family transporter [Gemmatimonadales bacterium]
MSTASAPVPQSSQPLERFILVRRVLLSLLAANLAVVAVKLAIGISANSLAIMGGALDSAVDALNNGLGMFLVRIASKAPDEDHPYGHDKFETLGMIAVVAFLFVSCFELLRDAIHHLITGGHPVVASDLQLAVLTLTLGVGGVVAWYEQRRGRELSSQLLIADAAHTRVDAFVMVGIIAGVLLARHGWWWADPVVAIVVALLILRVAWGTLSRAVPVLVDQRALPPRTIQERAEAVSGVRSAYGIRSRGTIPVRYAEVTIAVDRGANVADAHAIADEVEERLKQDLHLREVVVHVEPC